MFQIQLKCYTINYSIDACLIFLPKLNPLQLLSGIILILKEEKDLNWNL